MSDVKCNRCNVALDQGASFCKYCGRKGTAEAICNVCGMTCAIKGFNHGLCDETVHGGYESTPGNGHGALDDLSAYKFSLCEFCLDWLFSRFVVPVTVSSSINDEQEEWRPASQRVSEDGWRKMKDEFFVEHNKRATARKQ